MYADVILPLALEATLTYSVQQDSVVQVGSRVVVPLGARKLTGIVSALHQTAPLFKTRTIITVIDPEPIINPRQIKLMEWIAAYYLCPVGQVLRAMIPSGIKNADYNPPMLSVFMFEHEHMNQEQLCELLDSLARTKAQQKTLLHFIEHPHPMTMRQLLRCGATVSGLNGLLKKGIVHGSKVAITNYSKLSPLENEPCTTHFQLDGGTTLYWEHSHTDRVSMLSVQIRGQLSCGRVTLVVVPDNFSARRMAHSLSMIFEDGVVLFSGAQTVAQRSQSYLRLATSPQSVAVVVGTATALLLPYSTLGLVVVVDEHDYGHKQSESAPLLNSRDTALMLSHINICPTLLLSPSPSVESFFNTIIGRWKLIENDPVKVKIKVLERGKELLSKYLRGQIEQTISGGQRVILMQNRRGYGLYAECGDCGHTPTCPQCSVSLTLHQSKNALLCHHCQHSAPMVCPECGSSNLLPQGYGTERMEHIVGELFPNFKISRIDTDTIGEHPKEIEQIISNSNIIIATQLIVRGFQVDNVGLMAVLNADNLFVSPDFRTSERAMGLLLGLRSMVCEDGQMVIQNSSTGSSVVKALEWGQVKEFYQQEVTERIALGYPPATRITLLQLSFHDRELLHTAAYRLEASLRPTLGDALSAPYEPLVERTRGEWLLEMALRLKKGTSAEHLKKEILKAVAIFRREMPTVGLTVNVDPL
ncbi:MAG: primosomal protein N' [Mucinivorans sp.]